MEFVYIFVASCFLLSTVTVNGEEDDSACQIGNDGDLADRLNAKPFYLTLRPFPKKVFDAIPTEGFFHRLFNVSFPPKEVKKIFFDNCVYYAVNMGLNCPVPLCKGNAANANNAMKNGLTELQYFLVLANTLENSLKEEGQLYDSSVDDMIKTFIKSIGHFLYSDDAKGAKGALYALVDGAIKFFRGIGVTCMKDVSYIAQTYGDQLRKVASEGKEFGKAASGGSNSSSEDVEVEYSEVEVFTYTESYYTFTESYFTEYETEYFTYETTS